MTRFREEHYAKWRPKVPRPDHAVDPFVASARTVTECEERRALRSEYFKKASAGRTAVAKAQKRLLDG